MKLFTLVADLTLSTAAFTAGINDAKSKGQSLAQSLGMDAESIKNSFSDAFSFAAGELLADAVREGIRAMEDFVSESVVVASDLEETNSKIDAIFGSMSDNVHNWAKTTKEQFGIGEVAAKGYAAQFASLLSADSLALSTEQIYEMSTGLVGLAGDLASFHNLSFDTVWTKLLSGMRGETEAIEDLGIDVRAASLADYIGIPQTDWGYLDQQTRTLYTYQYIMENTTVAQGDFVRTQDQYANQMRIFNENITQLKASLGESLLPVMTDLVTWFNALFDSEEGAADGIDAVKDAYTTSYVSIETTTNNALSLVEALAELEAAGEDTAGSDAWNAILTQLQQTLPEIGGLIDAETGRITGGTEALRDYVEQWKQTSMELAQQKVVQGMYDKYAEIAAELATLETEQYIAEKMRTGATEAQDKLAEDLFAIMLSGMESMGSSKSDIEAFKRVVGVGGAEALLMRLMKDNANVDLIMSEIFKGGDIWTNKSFAKYFEAGGGTGDLLANMASLYSGYEATFERYNIDNSAAIAERQALLANQEQEIAILQQMLTSINQRAGITVEVNATLDGDQVAAKVEQRISRGAKNKSMVTGLVR